jgi:hypothetical protein
MDKLMNERIKALAERAGLSYLYDYDADGHAMVCSEADVKKFAELIVRECRDMFVVNSPSWNLLNEKLEHFGVEE